AGYPSPPAPQGPSTAILNRRIWASSYGMDASRNRAEHIATATETRSSSHANVGDRFGQAVLSYLWDHRRWRSGFAKGQQGKVARCGDQVATAIGRDGGLRQLAPLG